MLEIEKLKVIVDEDKAQIFEKFRDVYRNRKSKKYYRELKTIVDEYSIALKEKFLPVLTEDFMGGLSVIHLLSVSIN